MGENEDTLQKLCMCVFLYMLGGKHARNPSESVEERGSAWRQTSVADWGMLQEASHRRGWGVIATISIEAGLNFPQLEAKVLLRSSLIFSINQQNQIRHWLVNIFKISN